MKKIRIIVVLMISFALLSTEGFSASLLQKIDVYKNLSSLSVNSRNITTQTFQYNNVQYAPVKDVAESLGGFYSYDAKNKKITVSLSQNTSAISYPQTVDALQPSLSLSIVKAVPENIDGFKLERNGQKVDVQIAYQDGSIKMTPTTWLDYNSEYQLKLFINNGQRIIVKFKTSGLPALVPENGRKIIFVPADPSKGFNYPYYMVLPKKVNVDKNQGRKNYLFVETHNTGVVSDDLAVHIKEAYKVAEGNSEQIADALGLPRIVPIIVRPESSINGQWVYTHALSRNTITLENLKKEAGTYPDVFKDMDRVDKQVVNMIKHANSYLSSYGWKMEDKIFMWGFSASGDFTNRFAFLYPELVKAASFSGFPILPISQSGGYNMIFPLGTYDFKQITGKDFSLDAYNSVARWGYVGSADNNDPCILDTPYEQEIVNNLLAVREIDKWPKAKKLYATSGGQAQASIYIGAKHEIFYKGMTQDYLNFYIANRDSAQPVYVKPSDPANTTADFYSKNVIEMKTPANNYDKTTILEAFWSGTLPKYLPKSFIDWYKTLQDSNYKEGLFFISINEWQMGNDTQMSDRLAKAGNQLILRSTGHPDVTFTISGTMTTGDGQAQVYFAHVQNVQDMISGVQYSIVDPNNHWIPAVGVTVVRPQK